MNAAIRFVSILGSALAAAFFVGLAAFLMNIPERAASGPYEGIVVLTGGGGARITEGLSLLEESQAQRLLISGVFTGTTRQELSRFAPNAQTRFDCCVDIGRAAENTAGNGRETAEWARENGLTRIAVVTHAFHMPRARMELRRAAPEVTFKAHPVGGAFTRGPRRTIVEYIKFLIIVMRDSLAAPVRA